MLFQLACALDGSCPKLWNPCVPVPCGTQSCQRCLLSLVCICALHARSRAHCRPQCCHGRFGHKPPGSGQPRVFSQLPEVLNSITVMTSASTGPLVPVNLGIRRRHVRSFAMRRQKGHETLCAYSRCDPVDTDGHRADCTPSTGWDDGNLHAP